MPRGDGTGPMGLGPMTGRAAGFCAGYGVAGCARPVSGIGYSEMGIGFCGRGGGRGWRNRFYATGRAGWQRAASVMPVFGGAYAPEVTPQQQLNILKNQAEVLKGQLEDIQGRIETLEKPHAEKSE